MGTHHGKFGVVKTGSNGVSEIQGWTAEVSVDVVEDHAAGDTWKTRLAGFNDSSGTIECSWDESDTTGQQALTIGSAHTLNLYPEGSASGATFWTVPAIITKINYSVPKDNKITRSFNWIGNGAFSESTVSA